MPPTICSSLDAVLVSNMLYKAIKHIANTPRLLFIPTRTVITVDRMNKAYGKKYAYPFNIKDMSSEQQEL